MENMDPVTGDYIPTKLNTQQNNNKVSKFSANACIKLLG
jgi:hypothetical protein